MVGLATLMVPRGMSTAEATPDVVLAEVGRELESAERAIGALQTRATSLERRVAPGQGFINAEQAVQRYQDAVYFYLLSEYERAAESFFALVATGVLGDTGLHRDAEWYLADSLMLMGNNELAEESLLIIAEDDGHPFRSDAVRRLLELYARVGNAEAFDLLFRGEILSGRVKPSELITYSVGKAFHTRGEFQKAREYFQSLGESSEYYARAQYFIGAMLVAEAIERPDDARLREALTVFEPLTVRGVTTDSDRKVLDLSMLALGRIHYELGEFDEAALAYSQVGGDSDYLADKLHEIVWTFIKQEDYQQALRAVEIFLLAYPEHEYAAELKLNQGHLHFQEDEYDSALTRYDEVIAEYAPVRDRIARMVRDGDRRGGTFERVAELYNNRYSSSNDLPAYAVSMMMADDEMARAVAVDSELGRQLDVIRESQVLLDELKLALGEATGLGSFEGIRYELALAMADTLSQHLGVLRAEDAWLREVSGGKVDGQLDGIASRRIALDEIAVDVVTSARSVGFAISDRDAQLAEAEERSAQLTDRRDELADEREAALDRGDNARATALGARLERIDQDLAAEPPGDGRVGVLLDKLEQEQARALVQLLDGIEQTTSELATLRGVAGVDPRLDTMAQRFDAIYASASRTVERLQRIQQTLSQTESNELYRIRGRIDREDQAVAQQVVDLDDVTIEAKEVAEALTLASFRELQSFFEQSVLGADMGVVNVYWSRWLHLGEQLAKTNQERADLLSDVDRRFQVLEQKLGQ